MNRENMDLQRPDPVNEIQGSGDFASKCPR